MLNTFDQFAAREDYSAMCEALRDAQCRHRLSKFERCFVQAEEDGEGRMPLAAVAATQQSQTFVATVCRRGFMGKQRTVLLADLHPFGLKFLFAEHIWVRYDKKWAHIEPFVQGAKVLLIGAPVLYRRADGTEDYTLTVTKVAKL